MSGKVKSMSEAVRLVQDGQLPAVGGNALQHTPAAFCHELAKLGGKGLKGCGAAPGSVLDVRCRQQIS